ncbi:MAG TPA: DUF3800 domain-containing protein [Stellaceae bacterium]|nr:DUF3800 domain-containing protein [Stellaceae bacterium]
MSKEYVIHCDESTSKGEFCSNFYGGALVSSEELDQIRAILAKKKTELHLNGEVKWDKVTANYLEKYIGLIECFFDLIEAGSVKVRIMFTQNIHKAIGLTAEQRDEEYFILYYHFIKHAFGLIYSNDTDEVIQVRLLLDQLPDNKEKADKFRSFVASLSKNPKFRHAQIHIRKEDIGDAKSHDHDILQCLDIVLGSMQFRLNNLHKVVPKGKKRRGKRTVAKEKLYNRINQRIRGIYPNFNIGISTGTGGDIENRWKHPYRHWLFTPSESEYVPEKSKKKK